MIKLNNISFSYEDAEEKGLSNINLSIKKGDCVLLCGESGCGKTTITRLINGLIPYYYDGDLHGDVLIDGKCIRNLELYQIASIVGTVFQNPKSQFFNNNVMSELAFVCENMGIPQSEIEERISKTIKEFSMEHLINKSVSALSGGEKQRIACASVSVPNPMIYVLDEPSSNLDTYGIYLLRDIIKKLKAQGKTIVIAEHRLHYLLDIADRVVFMENGEINKEYCSKDFIAMEQQEKHSMGLRCTSLEELKPYTMPKPVLSQQKILLKNFDFAHKGQKQCLKIKELPIPKGSITAIIGGNGAGKSTLAKCLCGINKKCGTLVIDNQSQDYKKRLSTCYMVMQDVNHQLFTESVLDEVLLSMEKENEVMAESVLKELDLQAVMERHPVSLSGGQKQRTAVATAMVSEREVIVFDEPTSGLDYRHMQEVSNELRKLADKGKTLLVITHDPELILSCCNFVVEIKEGLVGSTYPLYKNANKLINYFMFGENKLGTKTNLQKHIAVHN